MPKPRKKYIAQSASAKARAVAAKLSTAQLQDFAILRSAVKSAGIKSHDTTLYQIRRDELNARGNSKPRNGAGPTADTIQLSHLTTVANAARQVGGIVQLRKIVAALEKLS